MTEPVAPIKADVIHLISLFKAIMDFIPSVLPARPAYPAINLPCSGDEVGGGALTVHVSSNVPSAAHYVRVLDGAGATEVHPPQPVTFGVGAANKGTTSVAIPAATGVVPPTDFILECSAPSAGGNTHRILVIRRGTTPPPTITVTISASAAPPYAVGQNVTFTATASGGTGPYFFTWNFGDGSFSTTNPASHAYSAAGTYTVNLTVRDSTSPTPVHGGSSFGPFQVNA